MKVSKTRTLLTVGSVIIGALLIYVFSATAKKKGINRIIFVGGLDNRAGDKNLQEQVSLVEKGLDKKIPVQAFRYNQGVKALNSLAQDEKSYVILFSAGCHYAAEIATKMKQMKGDLSNIFIVEPYHSGGSTTKSVKKAVELGVPSKNVFVGKTWATGFGIVSGTSSTPKCSPAHWCSLTEVSKIITKKL
jgi:hypothetical protein